VWAADTAGRLLALDLHTGDVLWQTRLGTPVLGGLAVSGSWLIATTYDGSVHGLAAATRVPEPPAPMRCDAAAPGGCCSAGGSSPSPASLVLIGAVAAAVLRRRRATRALIETG